MNLVPSLDRLAPKLNYTDLGCAKCAFQTCIESGRPMFGDLFPGLFVDFQHIGDFAPSKREDITYTIKNFNVVRRDVRSKRSTYRCCETEQQIIVPMEVEFEGTTYSVTHYQHSYQILVRGVCSSRKTKTCERCRQVQTFQWILIDDNSLGFIPPVRFVPVSYPSHCTCANIGT
ncbi:hypothetical protein ScPMuIL_017644 [Solemya velum]